MTTVLVTGGAGFIGSNYVRHLFAADPNARVVVVDALTYAGDLQNLPAAILESDRFEFVRGNINDAELLARLVAGADAVVHFAAETHVARSLENDRLFFETDVLGTQAVANAAVRFGRRVQRFVHISTSEVYGTAAYQPIDEDHPLNPTSPYAAAKAGADRLIHAYVETYGLPAVIVRPFNNYGPGQHLEKAVPRFVSSVLLGEYLTVHGQGEASRDWIFVDDVVKAIQMILEAPSELVTGQVFNLGTGRGVTVLDIARRVLDLSGTQHLSIEFMEERLGQVVCQVASSERARTVLGFRAETELDDGLLRTLRWYRDNPERWKRLAHQRRVPVHLPEGKVIWY